MLLSEIDVHLFVSLTVITKYSRSNSICRWPPVEHLRLATAENRHQELTVLSYILSLSLWKETKGFKRQWVIWWKPNNQEADQVSGFRVLTPIHITIFSCSLLTYTCGGIHNWHIILQNWFFFGPSYGGISVRVKYCHCFGLVAWDDLLRVVAGRRIVWS